LFTSVLVLPSRLNLKARYRDSLEEKVLEMASTTFAASIAALSTSGLTVDSMNVFHSRLGSLRCSLPCDSLAIFKEDPQGLVPLRHVKSLSISIADKLEGELGEIGLGDEEHESRKRADIRDQAHCSGLSTLLSSCDRLQQLCVSFYRVNGSTYFDEEHDVVRRRQVHRLLQASLPSLQVFCLGGIEVQIADLSSFLKRHSTTLRSLELTLVLIHDGLLSDILSLISSDSLRLDDICLTDMNDKDTTLTYFEGPKEQEHTTISGVYHGRNIIHQWGPATKELITHKHPGFKHREARRHADWRGQLADQFGVYQIVSPCILNRLSHLAV
jgi:hypothetical protein